jgi:hypothetical protein
VTRTRKTLTKGVVIALKRCQIGFDSGVAMRQSLFLALVISLLIPVTSSTPAPASNPTLNFYISPPTIQNTFVTAARVATFNSKPTGACPNTWQTDDGTTIGTITTNGCSISDANKFGGAAVGADADPFPPNGTTVPAAGTRFISVPSQKMVTLTLAQPETYLGFWWSAGDQNNRITLYSGGTSGTRVGIFQTSSLTNLLKDPTVTAIDGNSYKSCQYYGNPRLVDRTTNCAGENSSPSNDPNQPFAYIHLIGEGGLTFDTIVFTQVGGGGFELDNIAIERNVGSPPTTVILFPPELNATTPDLSATSCEPFPTSFGLIASNFAQTPTYQISPTSLPPGLSFNQATGGVSGSPTATFSKTTYTVTATAQTTATPPVTQTASTTVSLEVTACPEPPSPPPNPPTPVVWEPETTTFEVTEFPAIITPDPPPPPPGGGTYTFTGDPGSTSNCTVDRLTSTMTVPQPGTCVVTATVGDTKKLSRASITVTFTITGPGLAATGAAPAPLWALIVGIVGMALIAWSRPHSRGTIRLRND